MPLGQKVGDYLDKNTRLFPASEQNPRYIQHQNAFSCS
jgi:hypothetical protein